MAHIGIMEKWKLPFKVLRVFRLRSLGFRVMLSCTQILPL